MSETLEPGPTRGHSYVMRRWAIVMAAAILLATVAPASARPLWKRRIDRITAPRSMSVAVRLDGRPIYLRRATRRRVPASNQKLLTSMALLDRLGPDFRIATSAAAREVAGGVVRGDLFVLGRGDPSVAARGGYARSLSFRPSLLGRLARRLEAAGIRRVTGSVVGSTAYFRHDWFAPGWKDYFPELYVALPSALSLNGNTFGGRHVRDMEMRLARALTRRLESLGVRVRRRPQAHRPTSGVTPVASVESAPLRALMKYMNRRSSNFFAEMLGKRLGVEVRGRPGTIAKAAKVVQAWCRSRGVRVRAHDASGLSFRNRVSARGLVRLLAATRGAPWGRTLRKTLPTGGQGTLEERLHGLRLRAKTGTLDGISALSGWIWLRRVRRWAEFSILSSGMSKSVAVTKEDRIARTLARLRRPGRRTDTRTSARDASPVVAGSPPHRSPPSPSSISWWAALFSFL